MSGRVDALLGASQAQSVILAELSPSTSPRPNTCARAFEDSPRGILRRGSDSDGSCTSGEKRVLSSAASNHSSLQSSVSSVTMGSTPGLTYLPRGVSAACPRVQRVLQSEFVREIYEKITVGISADEPLTAAIALLDQHRTPFIGVHSSNRATTDCLELSDLLAEVVRGSDPKSLRVRDVVHLRDMVDVSTSLTVCAEMMTQKRATLLPVCDHEGNFVGVIRCSVVLDFMHDVFKQWLRAQQYVAARDSLPVAHHNTTSDPKIQALGEQLSGSRQPPTRKRIIRSAERFVTATLSGLKFELLIVGLVVVDCVLLALDFTSDSPTRFDMGVVNGYKLTTRLIALLFFIEVLSRGYVFGFRHFRRSLLGLTDAVVCVLSFVMVCVLFIVDRALPPAPPDPRAGTAAAHFVCNLVLRLLRLTRLRRVGTLNTLLLRRRISAHRRRFEGEGFDLDLTYITDNVIAMSVPTESGDIVYRNPIKEVALFFEANHGRKYRVYNLCSERTYSAQSFGGQVQHFPIADHNAPSLQTLWRFCSSVETWLAQDAENVVAVHCKGGKGRTGTMICAWLLASGQCRTADEALELFRVRRTASDTSVAQGVANPSQRRYVHYFERLLETGMPSLTKVLLDRVRVDCPPKVDRNSVHRSRLWFVIIQNGKQVFDSRKDMSRRVPVANAFALDFNLPSLELYGDIKVEAFHGLALVRRTPLFFVTFNTAFVSHNALELPFEEVDLACKDTSHRVFSSNFKITLYFRSGHVSLFTRRLSQRLAMSSPSLSSRAPGRLSAGPLADDDLDGSPERDAVFRSHIPHPRPSVTSIFAQLTTATPSSSSSSAAAAAAATSPHTTSASQATSTPPRATTPDSARSISGTHLPPTSHSPRSALASSHPPVASLSPRLSPSTSVAVALASSSAMTPGQLFVEQRLVLQDESQRQQQQQEQQHTQWQQLHSNQATSPSTPLPQSRVEPAASTALPQANTTTQPERAMPATRTPTTTSTQARTTPTTTTTSAPPKQGAVSTATPATPTSATTSTSPHPASSTAAQPSPTASATTAVRATPPTTTTTTTTTPARATPTTTTTPTPWVRPGNFPRNPFSSLAASAPSTHARGSATHATARKTPLSSSPTTTPRAPLSSSPPRTTAAAAAATTSSAPPASSSPRTTTATTTSSSSTSSTSNTSTAAAAAATTTPSAPPASSSPRTTTTTTTSSSSSTSITSTAAAAATTNTAPTKAPPSPPRAAAPSAAPRRPLPSASPRAAATTAATTNNDTTHTPSPSSSSPRATRGSGGGGIASGWRVIALDSDTVSPRAQQPQPQVHRPSPRQPLPQQQQQEAQAQAHDTTSLAPALVSPRSHARPRGDALQIEHAQQQHQLPSPSRVVPPLNLHQRFEQHRHQPPLASPSRPNSQKLDARLSQPSPSRRVVPPLNLHPSPPREESSPKPQPWSPERPTQPHASSPLTHAVDEPCEQGSDISDLSEQGSPVGLGMSSTAGSVRLMCPSSPNLSDRDELSDNDDFSPYSTPRGSRSGANTPGSSRSVRQGLEGYVLDAGVALEVGEVLRLVGSLDVDG